MKVIRVIHTILLYTQVQLPFLSTSNLQGYSVKVLISKYTDYIGVE